MPKFSTYRRRVAHAEYVRRQRLRFVAENVSPSQTRQSCQIKFVIVFLSILLISYVSHLRLDSRTVREMLLTLVTAFLVNLWMELFSSSKSMQ